MPSSLIEGLLGDSLRVRDVEALEVGFLGRGCCSGFKGLGFRDLGSGFEVCGLRVRLYSRFFGVRQMFQRF